MCVHNWSVSTQPAHRGNAIARSQHTTPAVRRLSTNAHLQLVSTQSTIKDIATARRQHATHAVGRRTTNVDLLPVSTQPAHTGNATARRQHTTLAVGRATHSLHLYQMSGRHDVSTKPCQDASTPQLVSTQPAPRGIATDGRQHTTLAVGRPTTNAHLYQLLQHAYRGSGRHDTSTCTKPCQDASTPQPVSTQPAPNGKASRHALAQTACEIRTSAQPVHEQLGTSCAPFERVTLPTQQPSLQPTMTHTHSSLKTCSSLPTACENCTRPHCGPHAKAHRGTATARSQHTTLAVGRPTPSAHLYNDMCTKPCQDASTP